MSAAQEFEQKSNEWHERVDSKIRELKPYRSKAERTRVWQGYVQIALSLVTIVLIILTRT